MATFYSDQIKQLNANKLSDSGQFTGRIRQQRCSLNLAVDTIESGDTIVLARLPKGARILFGTIQNSASLGASATLAIGFAGATGSLRAAAVKTSVTPEMFGLVAASAAGDGAGEPIAAEGREVIGTIAAANLPTTGRVEIVIFYTID